MESAGNTYSSGLMEFFPLPIYRCVCPVQVDVAVRSGRGIQCVMDLRLLSRIDEELDSSEVAALCFLCRDVLNRKRLETVEDGRGLFMRLQEKSLLEDHYFLSQLLSVIGRLDLLRLLETDGRQPEQTAHTQTDACPPLSQYRRMLYKVSEDVTKENLTKIKFLLSDKLPRGRLDPCTTALEVLCEMERQDLLTEDRLDELQRILEECDTQLAHTVQQHREARGSVSRQEYSVQPISNQEQQLSSPQSLQSLSISETRPSCEHGQRTRLSSDAMTETQPGSGPDQVTTSPMQSWKTSEMEHYSMTCNPRGTCLIINNHHFMGFSGLTDRPGTEQDEKALHNVFSRLGFKVEVCSDLTEKTMLGAVEELGGRSHIQADALVVCVLSHGEKGCVLGTDGGEVPISSLTQPFTSKQCPSLMGKPKLFFIQACQGKGFQRGALLLPSIRQREGRYEADAGAIESIPWHADFLIGMATVEECKSFRNTKEGSIYIQELCKQLEWGADRGEDILSVLTRVNREVSRGVYRDSKQMPEPKYTLTKKLFLPYF
ncbi:caspase-8 isoform X1 [Salvelinus fontinalis]|uniref:caspase-8 isoform X1 n=2 Tax=Salvelinus fontinalis TaxID=8038 RepID=UPI002485CD8E|nr:caspase-8 isoform X1 [Salvelinus fontinalis]